MSKLQHTQGDWRIRKTVDESGDYPFPTYDILAVHEWGPECVACAFQNPYNARLIAAAPEMLEELTTIFKGMKEYDCGGLDDYSITRLKELIEKATGMSIEEVLSQ